MSFRPIPTFLATVGLPALLLQSCVSNLGSHSTQKAEKEAITFVQAAYCLLPETEKNAGRGIGGAIAPINSTGKASLSPHRDYTPGYKILQVPTGVAYNKVNSTHFSFNGGIRAEATKIVSDLCKRLNPNSNEVRWTPTTPTGDITSYGSSKEDALVSLRKAAKTFKMNVEGTSTK
jgi:hypothetical protein